MRNKPNAVVKKNNAEKEVADFKHEHRITAYHVAYWTYNEKGDAVTVPENVANMDNARERGGACFSQLHGEAKGNNRVLYVPNIRELSKDEAINWIALCIREGILPAYIDPKSVAGKGIALDLKAPPSLTYVYLCNIRYVSEEPDIVRAVTHLVEKEGISIYAALVLCGRALCSNYGHNYLQGNGGYGYGGGPSLAGVKVTLNSVIGLRNYMRDPKKYNGKQIAFNAQGTVEKAMAEVKEVADLQLKWSDFKRPSVKALIASANEVEFKQALENYKMATRKHVLVVNDNADLGYSYYRPFEKFGPVTTNVELLKTDPDSIGLVVFTGGHDVTPALYGEPKDHRTYNSVERDDFEVEVFRQARSNNIPMFGICRGSQFLCVMAGGKLHQHVDRHGGFHDIATYDGRTIKVNSTHHQMQVPPENARLLAWASPSRHFDKDYREAECVAYDNINAIGVQYHPEALPAESDGFKYCVELCEELMKKPVEKAPPACKPTGF